jgi:hypothetical protein
VPFKQLKAGAPKAGDSWRINILRGTSSWSRLPYVNWDVYRDCDLVTFAAAQ